MANKTATRPAGARTPQDRKTKSTGSAARAAQREARTPREPDDVVDDAAVHDDDAEVLPYTFTYNGQEYEVDPDFRDDVEILEEIEDDHVIRAVRRILGDQQWSDWKDANRGPNGRISLETAQEFLQTMFEELGQGN